MPVSAAPPALVLASTSPYRRQLLARFCVPFSIAAPGVDETPRPGEAPVQLARRLALAKAQAVARQRPDAIVIGSDQVADLDGRAIGKPGSHARATEQLRTLSGRTVVFQTGLAVVCMTRAFEDARVVAAQVRFRTLTDATIERYLSTERPYDCAGSAKSEGLGIALLEAVVSDDPTALIGLPLIATARMLRDAGLDVLAAD